jgi:hypothetical protein
MQPGEAEAPNEDFRQKKWAILISICGGLRGRIAHGTLDEPLLKRS